MICVRFASRHTHACPVHMHIAQCPVHTQTHTQANTLTQWTQLYAKQIELDTARLQSNRTIFLFRRPQQLQSSSSRVTEGERERETENMFIRSRISTKAPKMTIKIVVVADEFSVSSVWRCRIHSFIDSFAHYTFILFRFVWSLTITAYSCRASACSQSTWSHFECKL